MVVIFACKEALDYLLERGFVITFRDHPLKDNDGNDIFGKGFNWITNKRGGRKIADVEIRWWDDYYIFPSPTEENENWKNILKQYVEDSGFKTVDDWIIVIKRFNKGRIPARGYLYGVEILRKRPCDEKGVFCWKHPKIENWVCPHVQIIDPHLGTICCVFPEYGSFYKK